MTISDGRADAIEYQRGPERVPSSALGVSREAMSSLRISFTILLLAGLLLPGAGTARAQQDPAVTRGLQYFRPRSHAMGQGESALAALAFIKADTPLNDPDLVKLIARLRTKFVSANYTPDRNGGPDIYEAAVVAMALSNYEPEKLRTELGALATYLSSKQNANGSWDYTNRQAGDTSITQYAVLGLWEAANGGADVPPEVFDHAAQWYLSVQAPDGGWCYHPDESFQNTLSMTAAGVGSLLICQRQLAKYRKHSETVSSLLTPILGEGQRARYDVQVSNARIEQAVKKGLTWLGSNFTIEGGAAIIGQTPYYCLYGIERIGALAERDTLGKVNWFEQGRAFMHKTQARLICSWNATHAGESNTAWCILFLTKSTAKSVAKIKLKQLGAGTLLGGRGLPRDLTNLTVAGGRVISRPMNGAVEGMLAVLEDPRAENADAALTGLVNRYRSDGAKVLKPHKDRFRKMLTDRDPGLRKVAAWALARTGELDVAPALIDRLNDPDEAVVNVAREGLMLLSRKVEGLGPPTPSTPEQRVEASKRWRAWYDGIRPIDLEGQDDDPGTPTSVGRGAK